MSIFGLLLPTVGKLLVGAATAALTKAITDTVSTQNDFNNYDNISRRSCVPTYSTGVQYNTEYDKPVEVPTFNINFHGEKRDVDIKYDPDTNNISVEVEKPKVKLKQAYIRL